MSWLVVRVANLPIALARRADPSLATRPLILVAERNGQVAVVAVSEPAVAVGLTLRQARLRCSSAHVQVYDSAPVAQAISELQRILARWSPRVLKLTPSPDVACAADLGRLPASRARALAQAIGDQITAQLGVSHSFGLGAHATIAHIAAQVAEPGALIRVLPGGEAAWLAPQPIDRLPLDDGLIARLCQFGLRSVGAVASLGRDALEAQFGPAGARLHVLAHGHALETPPPAATPVSLRIGWRFAGAVADQQPIDAALDRITRRLVQRLAHSGHAVRHLTLTLDLADVPPQDVTRVLAEPTSDPAGLRANLGALLGAAPLACGIERLTVDAELVALQAVQCELFPTSPARAEQLQALLTRLAPRHAAHMCRAAVAQPHAPCLEQRVQLDPWETP